MSPFVKRLLEQVAVTGGLAFIGVISASNGSVTKSVIVAALVAAGRAVYGLFVKPLGNPNQPNAVS